MPHISKGKITEKTQAEMGRLVDDMLLETSSRRRKRIFSELLTPTEKLMLAKRLTLIYLIEKDTPTFTISALLRVSPSTVARFETMVDRGAFYHTRAWARTYTRINTVLRLFLDLAAAPFRARNKSLSRLLDDI